MKLSVCIITRNQQTWIAEAITSVLSQRTDFDFEVVIGDDASDDETPVRLREIAQLSPNRLRVLSHEARLGLVGNFVRTVEECRGEYIAMLDGDDYWTDPDKLTLQTRYLDAHPSCALCFHQAAAVDSEGNALGWSFVDGTVPNPLGVASLIQDNWIPSSSAVWRRRSLPTFPAWFGQSMFEDWPLFLLLAMRGDVHFFPQSMSAYRQHAAGLWSSLSSVEQSRRMSSFLMFIEKNVDELPAPQLRMRAAYWKCREAEAEARAGRRLRAGQALLQAVWMMRFRLSDPESVREVWKAFGGTPSG